jgi:hypothetical protein
MRELGALELPSWMNKLNNCINSTKSDDLRFSGLFYTLSNKRQEGPIMRS